MQPRSSCTSVIVGKKASVDGTLMIARNEDSTTAFSPVTFIANPAESGEGRAYTMHNKKVVKLPDKALRYTSIPEQDTSKDGAYASAGFNEVHIALSATESLYGSTRALAFDPLVEKGIAEEAIPDLVLPYIHTAREGVEYLGKLIAEHGSAEGNGILFADREEAWYMEIPTGHHFVAVRIPDDAVAVAPNMACIQEVDFDDPENFYWSEGILDFVDKYKLNVNKDGFNFREIFGTCDAQDRIYNTPRAWDAMRYLAPQLLEKKGYTPASSDIPFIYKAEKLLDATDVAHVLSLHFDETDYDPLGRDGSARDRTRFRPISVSKTQESHILQIDPALDPAIGSVHWIALGATAYSPYVPFFPNVTETPAAWREVPEICDLDSAYWLFRVLGYVSEQQRFDDAMILANYKKALNRYGLARVREVQAAAQEQDPDKLTDFFEAANEATAQKVLELTQKHLSKLLINGFNRSKLTFKMNPDL